jgi:hypothetical protein
MNDVVIGAWREGLSKTMTLDIAAIEKRYNQGFRQLPFESTVMELVLILDAQDLMFSDLLIDMACECECDHIPDLPMSTDEFHNMLRVDTELKEAVAKSKGRAKK